MTRCERSVSRNYWYSPSTPCDDPYAFALQLYRFQPICIRLLLHTPTGSLKLSSADVHAASWKTFTSSVCVEVSRLAR